MNFVCAEILQNKIYIGKVSLCWRSTRTINCYCVNAMGCCKTIVVKSIVIKITIIKFYWMKMGDKMLRKMHTKIVKRRRRRKRKKERKSNIFSSFFSSPSSSCHYGAIEWNHYRQWIKLKYFDISSIFVG